MRIFSLSLAILTAAIFLTAMNIANQSKQDEDQLENVKLTNSAWDAYKKHQYKEAIQYSDRCIRKFKAKADDDQQALAKANAPMPPTGSVSKQQKEGIFKRGLLNDVATCFYIKGRSFEDMYRQDKDRDATLRQQAQEAYRATQGYTYARTWDTRGWFWSPSEDATDRLQDLK
jgi:outer membrane protein assembly factor BamD (BamD/ComL family)